MKHVVLCTFVVCLLVLGGALQAAPILAPPVPQCAVTAGTTGTSTDLIVPFATWSTPGFACEQQDKIYSNFSPDAIPTDTTLRLQVQPIGTQDFHTVTLNGNFLSGFAVSFDIAIDLTINPAELITRVTGDISNPSNMGTPFNVATVSSEGGTMLGSLTSTPGDPGVPITTANTALHVVDAYTPAGGAVVSISDTFREEIPAGAPEPLTYLMIGGGCVMLASLRRRRRR